MFLTDYIADVVFFLMSLTWLFHILPDPDIESVLIMSRLGTEHELHVYSCMYTGKA